ncbi:MAG: phosphate signaling complex protein PhoU [Thermoplasmatales archaeon]|nr:MAG: phosphate signaling complex protein PhoU [Thermoplasmatales archaeon]
MRSKFDEQLKKIKHDVVELGELAQTMLRESINALKNQDLKLAEKVYADKKKLMEMDDDIEHRCLQAISMYQPMAKDMRVIGASLKLITYLTRIGRYGKDIAKFVKELSDKTHVSKLVSIPHMSEIVESMIADALNAYKNEKPVDIQSFVDRDDDVDSIRVSIFREALTYMMEDSKKIERCMYYVMIARYLERCADHACKIAEKVNYMVTGVRVEIK